MTVDIPQEVEQLGGDVVHTVRMVARYGSITSMNTKRHLVKQNDVGNVEVSNRKNGKIIATVSLSGSNDTNE